MKKKQVEKGKTKKKKKKKRKGMILKAAFSFSIVFHPSGAKLKKILKKGKSLYIVTIT